MRISPISFGKIFKVQAPVHIVDQLADTVNSKKRTELAKDLKQIFDDRYKGEVKRYSTDENNHYLLSGNDSKRYDLYYGTLTINTMDKYFQRMQSLVDANVEGTMTVAHDGLSPKSVEIVK